MASFSQDKNSKLWSVRFRIIENNKEVNKRLSGFKQKKEANAAYVDFMSTYIAPKYIADENHILERKICDVFSMYILHAKERLDRQRFMR